MAAVLAELKGIEQRYGQDVALCIDALTLPDVPVTGIIGPDGVGKSTLLSILATARKVQQGSVRVRGKNLSIKAERRAAQARIAYMPQGLGKNLYASLSVYENVNYFAHLFGLEEPQRSSRIRRLLQSTDLWAFRERAAGKLSGGMKQKLSLCCALINNPDLLILDEPTTGVDPLSRRRFWDLVRQFQTERPYLRVIVATAYMEEAERFDYLLAPHGGRVIGEDSPDALKTRAGARTLESAFARLMHKAGSGTEKQADEGSARDLPLQDEQACVQPDADSEIVIEAHDLTQKFGSFTAVDHVSFAIRRGEIFGFLGSNGCGKTTTMKMLTGLLAPTEGTAKIFGQVLSPDDLLTRHRVGYMTQQFSLYGELSVEDNLRLHAQIFLFPEKRARERIKVLTQRFGLTRYLSEPAEALPLGVRQRLSLAVAVLHEPQLLILDEPTSGVDPVARDQFWALLYELSRSEGVTIFLSTHFMNEAMRCDRISLMHAGRVLIQGTPTSIIQHYGATSLEDAFVHALEEEQRVKADEERDEGGCVQDVSETDEGENVKPHENVGPYGLSPAHFSFRRIRSVARREGLELLRDPVRMAFAVLGAVVLMFVLASGISLDVENLPVVVYDADQSPESRDYIAQLDATQEFVVAGQVSSLPELMGALRSGQAAVAYFFPAEFGADLRRGRQPELAVWVDGAMPFRGETARGYALAVHNAILEQWVWLEKGLRVALPVKLVVRYRYNPELKSVNAIVPAVVPLLMIFIPAILAALGVVREKELGSIVNLYVTPLARTEFLLGKQVPYVVISALAFLLLLGQSVWAYGVTPKGSLAFLCLATLVYLVATTGIGLLVSTIARTQVAALFGTAILTMIPSIQFSGLTTPVSASEGLARLIGEGFPVSHYLTISRGVVTKALGAADLYPELTWLLAFAISYTLIAVWRLPDQEE